MFDFAWSEIVLIGAVALIAIGPKDMPAAIRTVSGMVKKARRMAAEFQTHVDEMVREADLGDVKKAFNDIRNLDIAGALEKHVDPDRSIRNTFADNPFEPTYPAAEPIRLRGKHRANDLTFDADARRRRPMTSCRHRRSKRRRSRRNRSAPAFIPPGMVPPPVQPAPPTPVEAPRFHSPRSRAATPVQGVGNAADHRKAERGKT